MTGDTAGLSPITKDGLHMLEPVGDPAQTLARMQKELTQWQDTLKTMQLGYAKGPEGPASPGFVETGTAIRMMEDLIVPRLAKISALPPAEQAKYLNLLVPFDTEGGLKAFLLHFFQFAPGRQDNVVYLERDAHEREVYILYDLYKVKKTLEVIRTLKQMLQTPPPGFVSTFSPAQQQSILDGMAQVLNLLFAQVIPPQGRTQLLADLSPAYLSKDALIKRREENTLYSFPHLLQKYDYRRFFFLIYFKDGMKVKMGQEEKEFRYSFLQFQLLKKEYLIYWLTQRMKNNPQKFSV